MGAGKGSPWLGAFVRLTASLLLIIPQQANISSSARE
jgi:hypothetical protein